MARQDTQCRSPQKSRHSHSHEHPAKETPEVAKACLPYGFYPCSKVPSLRRTSLSPSRSSSLAIQGVCKDSISCAGINPTLWESLAADRSKWSGVSSWQLGMKSDAIANKLKPPQLTATLFPAASVVTPVVLGLSDTAMRIVAGVDFHFRHKHQCARPSFLTQKDIHSFIQYT